MRTALLLLGTFGALALFAGAPALAAHRPGSDTRPPGLTPAQLHAAYELPAATSFSSSQTIALIELGGDPTLESDLAVYDRQYGLPSCTRANGCLRIIDAEGGASPLPTDAFRSGEASIDVQEAHAICQNCRILVVEGNPGSSNWIEETGIEVNTAVADGATEVTICIELYGDFVEAEELEYLPVANAKYFDHPGVPITVASGDCGYDETNDPEHWPFCESGHWHFPSFPAKSPTVVSVGGTSLHEHAGAWTSEVWAQSGSGCASAFAAPAWQLSVAGWQQIGCGTRRLNVDVAALASPHTGPSIYDTTRAGDWNFTGWGVAGGTSVAAPIVAAEFALAGGAHGVAYPAATLYAHAGESSAFEDVTRGSNGSCPAGSTICRAAVGYDGPSGLGTPIGLSAFSLAGAPLDTSGPRISRRPARGRTLVAHPGRWSNAPTWLGYQWERCNRSGSGCLPIEGATAQRYRLARSDVGRTIRVMVSAGNAMGFAPPAFTLPSAAVR